MSLFWEKFLTNGWTDGRVNERADGRTNQHRWPVGPKIGKTTLENFTDVDFPCDLPPNINFLSGTKNLFSSFWLLLLFLYMDCYWYKLGTVIKYK